MDYQHLTKTCQGHISIVTFNRPNSANALNTRLMEEIDHVAKSFLEEEETRVVFAGAGKHFSAGWDLKQPPPDPPRP